jgi:hypothetical protein
MRPLNTVAEWGPIAVYDLEAAFWVNITLVCHIDELGNRVNFPNVLEYLEWLFSPAFKGDVVFAHAGGRYDNRFLLEHVKAKGWNFRANMSGGTIVILSVSNGERTIKFGDSYRLMPDALEKIGKTVGLPKIELDPTLIHEKEFHEVLDYCYRDCEIVLRGLQLMRDTLTAQGCDFAFTLASIATRYLRRMPLQWHKFTKRAPGGKFIPRDDFKIWDRFCYLAYYGGRTEMFWLGIIRGKIYWFDIVSSYPASMRLLLPLYFKGQYTPPVNMTKAGLAKFLAHPGITECVVRIPDTEYITCLPVKLKDERLVFPVGIVSGAWTNIELSRALELGYEFLHVGVQHRFEGAHVLQGFIDKFYRLRQSAKDEKDEFGSYTFKILLNSSYGKTVETVDRLSFITAGEIVGCEEEGGRVEATNTQGVYSVKQEEIGPFRHTAMGAYITAYSRLRLFNMAHEMHQKGATIYYMDTDSLMLDMPLPETATGSGLGQWELVDILKEVELILPKVYRTVSATGKPDVYKCKGCPIIRKWEPPEVAAIRWHAFKHYGEQQLEEQARILGKDGITQFKTDINEGRLTPVRVQGPCLPCKKTGKIKGYICTLCEGTGKVHKPLIRSLKSGDQKRQWAGNESKPLLVNMQKQ